LRHAQRIGARLFVRSRGFVEMGGIDRGRLDADLPQEIEPARRG
jgi:hypothetical protein